MPDGNETADTARDQEITQGLLEGFGVNTNGLCRGMDAVHELQRIIAAAAHAEAIGLECHAGHGLTYDTVGPIAAIPTVVELNIGHFLIGEAIFVGLDASIRRMRALMDQARGR